MVTQRLAIPKEENGPFDCRLRLPRASRSSRPSIWLLKRLLEETGIGRERVTLREGPLRATCRSRFERGIPRRGEVRLPISHRRGPFGLGGLRAS